MEQITREVCEGWCRCCLEKGLFDIEDNTLDSVGPDTNNITYLEMLMSCFSLDIDFTVSQEDDGEAVHPNDNNLICDLCVVRIKEAYVFKQQVEQAHRNWDTRLVKVRSEQPFKAEFETTIIKIEEPSVEDDALEDDNWHVECLDEDRDLVTGEGLQLEPPKPKLSQIQQSIKKSKYTFSTNYGIIKEEYGTKFVSERVWKQILYSKINLAEKKCHICEGIFNNTFVLIRHLTDHYPVYTCDFCGKAFCTKKSVILHGFTHEIEEHKCKTCGKVFHNKYRLRHHLERHAEILSHRCNLCPQRFKNAHQRRIHMVSAHDAPPNPYKCKDCDLAFLSIGKLNSHVRRIHLKERNQICSSCGMGFFSKFELSKHMYHSHGDDPIYQCDICQKGFTWPKALVTHLKTHTEPL